ncbi:7,8-didemethyl-8-hydroxy-5-deazariboflavin synthase subunit CofG [Spirulina subsalsa FACHB-351]|uniref:7,8-didemethyl-8-hydroxy-5-deazariboflavin synthase n=1 Tax=Spirulina subsalsa FACHB-351 TaxID=234711 RepID=A0ABT3L3G7_9CYAN|nr:7,8-didemethyl-8-hydroxy-5-deazariboflavin synthase subunit CofG [Spirulina subsalsa]MCW6036056.1 7,8-didemethyl-8-hydroxy-5-deazariboflavin synthase subunit CofG [Spirulina subsalsa FACHB-351]
MEEGRKITYSPAYTLVPTYECFNCCGYCNFREDPGVGDWLSLREAEGILRSLQNSGVVEILILSGEVHPQSSRRGAWFERIYQLCELALSLGYLPHTNVGPLSRWEMARLREVNVSMGLMVEQVTPRLLETVHRLAPSKRPEVRLQQLIWAGELRIPFTTGLLLGIGEQEEDWADSLRAIASIHEQYQHIQEVILQPHSQGATQSYEGEAREEGQLLRAVALAREILPPEITLQIPPNLVGDGAMLRACLAAGARDLGGIGPKDEVNPDYPHVQVAALQEAIAPDGWQLVPRLPVYPQYLGWLSEPLQGLVKPSPPLNPNHHHE